MKKPILFLFMLLAPFTFQTVHAQLVNRIKNAAERGVTRAIEKKVENEVEKMARKKLDKAFEGITGPDGETPPGIDIDKIIGAMSADVEVAESYSFSGFLTMEISGTDEKGKEFSPTNIKSYLSESQQITGMEFEDKDQKKKSMTIMIFDLDRNASIILLESEGEKSSIAYGYDYASLNDAELNQNWEEGETQSFAFKKTGSTKTIKGYNCEEYLMETEDGTAIYWITTTPLQGTTNLWSESNPYYGNKIKYSNPEIFKNMPKGNIFEVDYKSKTDNSTMLMTVVDIDEKAAKTFKMKDFPNIMKSK
jgi:hypothetical protein